jgi:DNA-binding transcriptional regulator YdaS (Cro superfamily)
MATWKDHLTRAVEHLGSQPKLAHAMGCSQSKVSWLLVTAKQISAEDALTIHRATKGHVKASELRPDLFQWDDDRRELVPDVVPVDEQRAAS